MLGCVGIAFAAVDGQVLLADGSPAVNAVVWIKGSEHATPLFKAVMDQRNLAFIPHVLAVPMGTTVSFPNNDTVFHNIFAEFRAKRFDLGMYPRGTSKKVKFDKEGLVALLCSVHSNMSAYIMVVDTPYYAVTDKKGKFHVSTSPSGSGELNVWHESGQTMRIPYTSMNGPLRIRLVRQ
jgi:plastocyanin